MKGIKQFSLIFLSCLLSTFSLSAQDNSDSYLKGAVPEVDGKVTFAKVIHVPGVSQKVIYDKIFNWMDGYLKQQGPTSRVVYQDPEKGIIVGAGSDTIVFKANFLSLDQTFINYQIEARVKDAECDLQVTKITYKYQQDEKYTAEEMISDKAALNKAQTKIYKGLQKWRIHTVDFMNELFADATQALGALKVNTPTAPTSQYQAPVAVAKEYKAANVDSNIKETSIYSVIYNKNGACLMQLDGSPIKYNITNYFSGLGNFLGKERIYLTVPMSEDFFDQLEETDTFKISFYNNPNDKEPAITFTCKKAISQSIVPESIVDSALRKELAKQPIHKFYINDIVDVVINK